jgi:hypothetical protein
MKVFSLFVTTEYANSDQLRRRGKPGLKIWYLLLVTSFVFWTGHFCRLRHEGFFTFHGWHCCWKDLADVRNDRRGKENGEIPEEQDGRHFTSPEEKKPLDSTECGMHRWRH